VGTGLKFLTPNNKIYLLWPSLLYCQRGIVSNVIGGNVFEQVDYDGSVISIGTYRHTIVRTCGIIIDEIIKYDVNRW